MTGFRCAADGDHQVPADRSLDVCCQVVRTGACDPERTSINAYVRGDCQRSRQVPIEQPVRLPSASVILEKSVISLMPIFGYLTLTFHFPPTSSTSYSYLKLLHEMVKPSFLENAVNLLILEILEQL